MKKIFLFSIIAFIFSFTLFLPLTFANTMINDAGNAVKDTVNGAENVVQDAANGTTGAIRNGINTLEDFGNKTMNNVKNGANNVMNNDENGNNNMNNTMNNIGDGVNNAASDIGNSINHAGYTVQRTATDASNSFFGFMNNYNIWAWIVIGIVALIVVGIIWYYMATRNNYSNHDDK